ncbi:hypothetical protein ABB37_00007 [Leptomonas pyrrhocoris]|uniref:C3H1-type domain-containing protein n=1 Tax=Leptomonas pyrrhocoris TaxID=157538 RepID=A0A0M9G9T7_LEPPY|nr:hypothetical protein ABB37_00007 [Leptomonas pyrrhocoris]KPA85596.1 hypothetical protein ABB37_00007 [Leptomonas pyrrhocoris]|eukprot:XP_015664035.1 hypothetical protein ABB37_00007 [Leptomonas pyrrhocoris]
MSVHSANSSRSKKMRSKKWDTIQIPSIDELELMTEAEIQKMTLPVGFCVRFFCHDMDHLFTVASGQVKVTRGVLDYLHDYNQLGPNKSRNKLFVCSQYNRTKECLNGSLCREVHCALNVDDAEDALKYQVPSNATGAPNVVTLASAEDILTKKLNEPLTAGTAVPAFSTVDDSNPLESIVGGGGATDIGTCIYMPDGLILRHSLHTRWTSTKTYPTLPPGVEFRVALPNTPTPVDAYDSSVLFVTRGAQEYYNQCKRNEQPAVTMQHCAHYSKNGICCFGEDCQFVHVVHYKVHDRAEGSFSDPEALSLCSSSANSESGRRRSTRRGSVRTRETPLTTSGRDKKGDSLSSSRSSSSSHDPLTPHQRPLGTSINNVQAGPPNKTVFVPSASGWQPMNAAPGSLPPPPPPPPHFGQEQMMYPMPAQPPQLMTQPYMVMQGPNGQCYIVPQASPGVMPQAMQNTTNQPMYVMPMPFQ